MANDEIKFLPIFQILDIKNIWFLLELEMALATAIKKKFEPVWFGKKLYTIFLLLSKVFSIYKLELYKKNKCEATLLALTFSRMSFLSSEKLLIAFFPLSDPSVYTDQKYALTRAKNSKITKSNWRLALLLKRYTHSKS